MLPFIAGPVLEARAEVTLGWYPFHVLCHIKRYEVYYMIYMYVYLYELIIIILRQTIHDLVLNVLNLPYKFNIE